MQKDLSDFIQQRLDGARAENALRTLTTSSLPADFTSNDYLGLARTAELFEKIKEKVDTLSPRRNGATGSRLLSGNDDYTIAVERKLAHLFKADHTLIFNSGYVANMAVLSSIPQRGDTIILDELAHACMKDGARLSLAKHFSFRHNDLNDLESKLRRAEGKKFIAVESVYSMDGDVCPLKELVALSEKYQASIILDEAHSTGVVGENGGGLAIAEDLHQRIAVRVYTFGKAMGVHGACVAGTDQLVQYLVNFARPFIYTTALPPHSIAAIACAFDFLKENTSLQRNLQQNVGRYNALAKEVRGIGVGSGHIQTISFPGNENVKAAAQSVRAKGFDVRPILSPTVPAGSERLRICLHAYNTDQEIQGLIEALKSFTDKQ